MRERVPELVGMQAGETGLTATPRQQLAHTRVTQRTLGTEPQRLGAADRGMVAAGTDIAGKGLTGRRRDRHDPHPGLAAERQVVLASIPVVDGEVDQLAPAAAGVEQHADDGVVAA
jgi:hypothetical protein